MGSNFPDFIREARRVMKLGATLLVAEVRSRFAGEAEVNNVDGSAADEEEGAYLTYPAFVTLLGNLGYKLKSFDRGNKMFVLFTFELVKRTEDGDGARKRSQRDRCVRRGSKKKRGKRARSSLLNRVST